MMNSEALAATQTTPAAVVANQALPAHVSFCTQVHDLARHAMGASTLAIYERQVAEGLQSFVDNLSPEALPSETRTVAAVQARVAVAGFLSQLWPEPSLGRQLLCHDVSNLVEHYAHITASRRIRITIDGNYSHANNTFGAFDGRMRMVSTYRGSSVEWLPNELVDREMLETADNSLICDDPNAINTLPRYAVALIKGEKAMGCAGMGLVARDAVPEDKSQGRLHIILDQNQ